MTRRPPRSPLSSSSAASDVYKRQVSTQSTGIFQSPAMVPSSWAVVLMIALVANAAQDAPDLADVQHYSALAGIKSADREREYASMAKHPKTAAVPVVVRSYDLKEALSAWDAPDNIQRAKGAGEQAADLEEEYARRASQTSDLGLDAVLSAIAEEGQPDKRQVLFSFLSEDYRKGGASSYNKNDYYIRHQNDKLAVTTFAGPTDRQDATFKMIPALCGPGTGQCPAKNAGAKGCVSIESTNWQRHYLVQQEAGELSLAQGDGSDGFRAAATWCLRPGVGNEENGVSIEPLGEPEKFILHDGYHLVIGDIQGAGTKGTSGSATYRLRPGLFMGGCQGPDEPTECTCLPGYLGDSCAQPCPGLEVSADGTAEVCRNNGDCVLSKRGEAVCDCNQGFLGAECNLLCPRSTKNSKLCHGRGQCAVNEAFQPTCKCEAGFLGTDCSVACPGANAEVGACSDQGKCLLDESGSSAKCVCNDGYKGSDCFLNCPRDQADNVCSGHGECSVVGDQDTQCACQHGWVGHACEFECPQDKAGDTCSNHGECILKEQAGHCKCDGGYLGLSCQAACPGLTSLGQNVTEGAPTVGCNGHGDCVFDADTGTANCNCHVGDGWIGEGCLKECPRGDDKQGSQDAVCSGHGNCELDEDELPVCECASLYGGPSCGVNCPTMVRGAACSGHGTCNPSEDEEAASGSCECQEGWLGDHCGLGCPPSQNGALCGGHGACEIANENAQAPSAKCQCETQWAGSTCEEAKCGSVGGFFNKENNECKCPADSEKCCSRDVLDLSLIHISEPTRLLSISYAVFCLKKKKKKNKKENKRI
eukprot:TRINITY_DN743_c0_g1_i3.p1 TRINITY_DN743_c0_g1~~TRINITY_DN743_c0_g1_i3.p1  ORF type:complete len:818 (+),score=189.61 TRINITY_DN743_c0_g1_i3:57-2510(+)